MPREGAGSRSIQEPEDLPVGWTDRARVTRAGRRLEDQARRVQSSIPPFRELGFFIFRGERQSGWPGGFGSRCKPSLAGSAGTRRSLLHGVSAPLLIHGALAAPVPVMGGAMHQNRGRQDFFGARGPGPLPGPGLIASCAQTGNFFVAAGLTVKTQIRPKSPFVKGGL